MKGTSRLATILAVCYRQTHRRCSGRPRCSPTEKRTGTSTMGSRTGTSTTRSRRSLHRMQGRPLDRSLCDDHTLALCI